MVLREHRVPSSVSAGRKCECELHALCTSGEEHCRIFYRDQWVLLHFSFFTPVPVKKLTPKHQNTNNGSVSRTLLLRLVTAKQDTVRNASKPDEVLPPKTPRPRCSKAQHNLLIQVLKLRRKRNIFKNQIILYELIT